MRFQEIPHICAPECEDDVDEAGYLKANPDVAAVGMPPKLHFNAHGRQEGRRQIINEPAIRNLRAVKLGSFEFQGSPSPPNVPGRALNFISSAELHEFGIPDKPPVSSHAYDEAVLALIRNNPNKRFLDIGSGLRPTYFSNVVTTEIYESVTTDVLCVGEKLPLADAQFDFVFAFAVLEHTRRPWDVAAEMCRVLKPGGFIHVDYPHLQPVHGYPHHYFNATPQGNRSLFERECDVVSLGLHQAQKPLFALRWILSVWRDGLAPEDQRIFEEWSIGEVVNQPVGLQLSLPQCRRLNEQTQMMIAAGTYLVAQKRVGNLTA